MWHPNRKFFPVTMNQTSLFYQDYLGAFIIFVILVASPAIILALAGLILYRRGKRKAAKICFIICGVYLLICLGICGGLYINN